MAGALFTLVLVVGLAAPTDVKAAVVYPDGFGNLPVSFTLASPLTLTAVPRNALFTADASGDIGSQNPANVESFLESSVGFNTPLTFVGGGACGIIDFCDNENNANSGTLIEMADVFAVHFDNKFLAFLYPAPISSFGISGLPNGLSNIYAYNTSVVPLPAALPLYGSALAVLGLIGWRRKRMAA